jgi:serine acetyltransferase/thymidylate kinase
MRHSFALVTALCRHFNEERIEYCVLGEGAVDSIDMIVAAQSRSRVPAALRSFCQRNDMDLVHYERAECAVDCFGLYAVDRDRPAGYTVVTVRCECRYFGRVVFTAEDLLRDRVLAVERAGHGRGYFLAAPAKEFLSHLLRCIEKGELTDRDGMHLSEQWREDPLGVAMQVGRFWNSSREGGVILRAAASGNWEPVQASLRALRLALNLRNVAPPFAWLRTALRKMRAWLEPSGLLIACLGPHGSGKSSVIRALSEEPMAPFRDVHKMALRPGVMRPASVGTAGEPRRRPPLGRLGTMAKLMMFVADYWLGYWLRIRPRLVRSTLVLADRYFDDVLVDPDRYRMRRPRAFARLLLRWIPRPDLWLIFDATPEVLEARHSQVAEAEAARQRAEYRRVLRGRENVVVLDANQPIQRVVTQAERAIVMQLARRTAERLGLPVDTTKNPAATRLLLLCSRRRIPVVSSFVRVLFNSDIRCRVPPDLYMPQPYGIVIHPQAVIGRRVTIMQQVLIGSRDPDESIAPVIGDDVYIGAGARVLGDVRIGQGAVIGANAVVTQDIPPGVTVVGANRVVPARGAPATAHAADSSVAQFPVGMRRGKGS